ncbi:MAG: universal stress protein [Pseudomonadota bacterium]
MKRIMVGMCRSPAQVQIAPIAVDLALRSKAVVTVMSLIDPDRVAPRRPPTAGVFPSKIKEQEDNLARALEEVSRPLNALKEAAEREGVEFQTKQVGESLDGSLCDLWQFQDLIVLSNTPWLGGEASPRDVTQVLHFMVQGIRPILSVAPYASLERKKAMVALSGSLESAKALKHFLQLTPWPAISLHLVTSGAPKSGADPEQLLADAAGYVADYGLEVTAARLEAVKNRTEQLLGEAEAVGADTLVLGSSYRKFLTMERFGNHAQQLLAAFKGAVFLSH